MPSKWSVRDIFNGDVWHLALAYFQTGLADEGWDLLQGRLLETAYAGTVPGGFSHIGAGTDFADCKDMFARAVVEGLFGYDPDYPNGLVRMRPAFPSAWPKASIKTPDYTFDYRQDGADRQLPPDPRPRRPRWTSACPYAPSKCNESRSAVGTSSGRPKRDSVAPWIRLAHIQDQFGRGRNRTGPIDCRSTPRLRSRERPATQFACPYRAGRIIPLAGFSRGSIGGPSRGERS